MRDERYAFGGHAGTVKAIREHREWHDGVNRTPEPGEVYGLSATCWKEAEHVRFLLARIAALEEALRGVIDKVVAEDGCYDDGKLVVDFEVAERAHDEVAVALSDARKALGDTPFTAFRRKDAEGESK